MEAREALDRVRSHYVDFYADAIERLRETYPTATPEVLIEPNGSTAPLPFRLWRIDVIYDLDGETKLTECNQSSYLPFTPCEIQVGDLSVRLHPLYWNGVEFRGASPPRDWAPFEAWVRKWLDPDDSRVSGGPELGDVVHSVLAPEIVDESWSTSVDFGSAPTEAFWNLLSVLEEGGVTSVEVGSFSMIEGDEGGSSEGPV